LGSTSAAATIHGTVVLPADKAEVSEGLWRVDNGVLTVLSRPSEARSDCVLLLTPKDASTKEPKPETVTVELKGMRLVPQVVAVPIGGTIEIKNEDHVPHSISAGDLLPARSTPASTTRTERVQRPGIYPLVDDEVPHVHGWLLVTEGGTVARPDERGAWHADVPDGRYELQLFYRGAFVTSRTLDVNAKTADTTLTVGARP